VEELSDSVLTLLDLTKTYMSFPKPKKAVKGLSLSVPRSECFGFLGVNGAGKTTTLSVITGDVYASSGVAQVMGVDIMNPDVWKLIGYCPQIDPLIDLMTGRETLSFFGKIRGIHPDELDFEVESTLERVGLSRYADQACGRYSGGNKRKLSLAIALLSHPPLILLDEPSSGMDVEAKRKMWSVIRGIHESSVVLTSHSLEEIEALCTRVGIMVDGKFKCIGSIQHLKPKFNGGYEIHIRCAIEGQAVSDLKKQLEGVVFKGFGYDMKEEHGRYLSYQVFSFDLREEWKEENEVSLGDLFDRLEMLKNVQLIVDGRERAWIEDYSISQVSLEQIFISVAHQYDTVNIQEEKEEEEEEKKEEEQQSFELVSMNTGNDILSSTTLNSSKEARL